MRAFIVKRTFKGIEPAGELEQLSQGIRLRFNDYTLFRVVKALASRSLCSKEITKGKTSKNICTNKFGEIIRRIKKPFFFSDEIIVPWKYTEVFNAA